MSGHLYALCVAIDAYRQPVQPLSGCVNDIGEFVTYLKSRVADDSLTLQTLFDKDAKREALVTSLRDFYKRAQSEDTVLFYFCGHGSQEPTPQPLWHLEPDKLNETLVCWDSRNEAWDIADKEQTHLLSLGNQNAPHRLVILDCCHSGTGTRSALLQSRQTLPDSRSRPIDSYLFSDELKISRASGQRFDLGLPSHILLAACREDERAYEINDSGNHVGLFSHHLLHSLTRSQANLSYRDLFKRISTNMQRSTRMQHPQLEAVDRSDLSSMFLGAVPLEPQTSYFTMSFQNQNWILDAGKLHGISASDASFIVFEQDESITAPLEVKYKAEIHIQQLDAHQSILEIPENVNFGTDEIYKAILIRNKQESLQISIADTELADTIQAHLPDSIIIRDNNPAQWKIEHKDGNYVLEHHDGDTQKHFSHPSLSEFISLLSQIERWCRIRYLDNPTPIKLDSQALRIECAPVARGRQKLSMPADWTSTEHTTPYHIERRYSDTGAGWQFPVYELRLTNAIDVPLYIAVLLFHDDYQIQNLLPEGTYRLPPEQTRSIRMGGSVSDDLWNAGKYESASALKIMICTADFDSSSLESDVALRHGSEQTGVGLNQHLPAVNPSHDAQELDDWFTIDLELLIIRPPEASTTLK